MSEIGSVVDSIEIRMQKLFRKLESLQQINQQLVDKLTETESTINSQNLELKTLQGNFDSIKITNSLLGSDEYKRETKLKINSLIREIDYCIAQLSD